MSIPIEGSGKPNLPFVVEGKKTPKEPMQVASGLVHQNEFLQKLLGGEKGISTAITFLRNDRFSNSKQLTEFLNKKISELSSSELPSIDDPQKDPLFSMLLLILNNDPDEDLRKEAAETYIDKHPEDERFEKAYAYLKDPHILVAHLLISTNQWKCANPKNEEFYDEQMAGLFHGTVAFDKGDQLSIDEWLKIQPEEKKEDYEKAIKSLGIKDDFKINVEEWFSTPAMCPSETRLDDLFIVSRRNVQGRVVEDYIASLKETSSIIQKYYSLPHNKSAVVAVIGPYGVGKSRFTGKKFSKEEKITTFDLDELNTLLMKSTSHTSRSQDHHFEAMMLCKKLLSRLTEVPALLTETAAIDEYRFKRLLNRDFVSRDQIIIEEIAPEKPSDAIDRFKSREGKVDLSRLRAATTSVNDALKFRIGRIDMAKKNPKIDYTLYCNKQDNKGNPVFIEVAKAQNGKVTVTEGQEKLYEKLTPPRESKE